MATVFEARPLSSSASAPVHEDQSSVTDALDSLEAAAMQVYNVVDARPEARRRAAELLTFYARRLHAVDYEESWDD